MRLVFGFVLLLGIGLAGAAVYMAKNYFGEQQAALQAARALEEQIVPTVEVYVVNKQMRYGQRLTMDDVRRVRWPESAIPEGAFFDEKVLFPEGPNLLRSVLRTMEVDEAVMAVKVTEPGEDAGVSSRLSPGMRAFTIRTDAATGGGGFVTPGSRVDINWTGVVQGRSRTQLIDTNVRVIAVNQSADEDGNRTILARTVTVEVNPSQVAQLATAQEAGRLSLALVGADDDNRVEEQIVVDLNSVLGIEEQIVEEVKEKERCFITQRQGTEETRREIECQN